MRNDKFFLSEADGKIKFDTEKILEDNGFEADFAVLGALAMILYGTGIIIFCRRDLPL